MLRCEVVGRESRSSGGLWCRLLYKLEGAYDGIWDTPHAFQYLTRQEEGFLGHSRVYLLPVVL
jgi:hypothetical protein